MYREFFMQAEIKCVQYVSIVYGMLNIYTGASPHPPSPLPPSAPNTNIRPLAFTAALSWAASRRPSLIIKMYIGGLWPPLQGPRRHPSGPAKRNHHGRLVRDPHPSDHCNNCRSSCSPTEPAELCHLRESGAWWLHPSSVESFGRLCV
jgi:hypothetical protein